MEKKKGGKIMPNLQCNVYSCSSNKTGHCCRPSINVNGATAYSLSDTGCQSFTENTQTQMINGTHYDSPNQSLSVNCDAHRCIYNKNQVCTADSICINYGSLGTECSSFKQK